MYPLFQASHGRFSNNFTQYRESFTPEYQPGGGGWSAFQFTLDNLFTENQRLNNWWSKSNKGLNLCRYNGLKVKLYRQPTVDYVVTYSTEWPFDMSKFHFTSSHPQRLLTYNHKIVVPSFKTCPLKKKNYISKYIRPPKEMIDQWYFQQNFAKTPLVMFIATACDLTHFYAPDNVESINVSVFTLNTKKFQYKDFQTKNTQGYNPAPGQYLYSTKNATFNPSSLPKKDVIYLGNSMYYGVGTPLNSLQVTNYTYNYWGNPFHTDYLLGERETFQSTTQYTSLLTGTGNVTENLITKNIEPFVISVRYNPYKDDGVGNKAYFVNNIDKQQGWEPTDTDLLIEGFPLWILLWGFEDYVRKLSKVHNLNQDYVLVIQTKYFDTSDKYYVLLNNSFVHGSGPYNMPIEEVPKSQLNHWYPQWKFQKEAIENIISTGPAVCRAETKKLIQAHMFYKFYFKWGGNPATMEKVFNPLQQPTYPRPSGLSLQTEITDPNTPASNYIYNFDVRRHLITQAATKRIYEISKDDLSMFTDGSPPTKKSKFEIPLQTNETSQETTTEEEETQTPIQQQLQLYKQHNQQLKLRYRQLKQLLETIE